MSVPTSPTRPAFSPGSQCVLVEAAILLGLVCPQSQTLHVPVGTATWPYLASSQSQLLRVLDEFCDPSWFGLLLPPVSVQTSECSPTEEHKCLTESAPRSGFSGILLGTTVQLDIAYPLLQHISRYCSLTQPRMSFSLSFCVGQWVMDDAI